MDQQVSQEMMNGGARKMMSIRIYSFRMQAPAELCLGVQPRSDGVFALSYVQCFLMNADR